MSDRDPLPIEFRNYRPSDRQMLEWLTSMSYLYDHLHKGDPEWIHPMSSHPLPSNLSMLSKSYQPVVTQAVRDVFESSSKDPSMGT